MSVYCEHDNSNVSLCATCLSSALDAAVKDMERLTKENAELKKEKHAIFCDNCGAIYYDDGFGTSCPCKLRAEVERVMMLALEASRWLREAEIRFTAIAQQVRGEQNLGYGVAAGKLEMAVVSLRAAIRAILDGEESCEK